MRRLSLAARRILFAAFFLPGMLLMAQPANDDPCGATPIEVGDECVFNTFATNGATRSAVADPSCGDYAGSNDVWFVTIAPASGTLDINTRAGSLRDMSMAIYTANSCNGPFTEVACAIEGGSSANMPRVTLTQLNPGTYVFIRVWDRVCTSFILCGFNQDSYQQGNFGLCVKENYSYVGSGSGNTGSYNCGNTPPAGNTCEEASVICTFDGYCGSTSGYTPEYWYNGSQGLGGPSTSDGIFCGSIENNSFTKFIAGTSNIVLDVIVSGSSSACDDGVQFMMFGNPTGGPICQSLEIVSYGCLSPMPIGTNRFEASGLTVGQEYYLMVDGYAGDICSYQINAISGVLVGVSAGEDRTVCLGEDVTLQVFGAAPGLVEWSGPNLSSTSGQTVKAKPTAPGTYQYIVDAPNLGAACGGSARSKDTVLVTVLPTFEDFTLTQTGGCDGNGVTITVSGATTFTWTPSLGLSATTGSPVVAKPPVPTTYTVYASNENGCFAKKNISVDANGVIVLTVEGEETICLGAGGTTLTASSGFDSYSWSPATGLSGTSGQIVTANPTQPGTYTYTVTGKQAGCPDVTASVTINVESSSSITIDPADTEVCVGGSVTLTANPPSAYSWSGPGGFSQTDASSVTVSPNATGDYIVFSPSLACLFPDTITVKVNPIPAAPQPLNGNRCTPGSVTLSIASQCNGIVNWYELPTGGQPVGTGLTFETPSISETISYYASCSENGCEGPRAEVEATFENIPPVVDVTQQVQIECAERQVQLSSSSTSSDVTYQWQGPGIVSGADSPTPIVNKGGIYTVTVTNDCGTGTASVTVTEDPECICEVFIPNAFSPNGDGKNDRFILQQDGIVSSRLYIYTRWGEKVFETTSLDETWDGTYQGKMAQADVFGYYYEGTCNTGEKVIRQGNITVVK